jgi:hypothetical protein
MGGSLSLRPAWSIERIPGQPGLCRQTLSQKTKKKKDMTHINSFNHHIIFLMPENIMNFLERLWPSL